MLDLIKAYSGLTMFRNVYRKLPYPLFHNAGSCITGQCNIFFAHLLDDFPHCLTQTRAVASVGVINRGGRQSTCGQPFSTRAKAVCSQYCMSFLAAFVNSCFALGYCLLRKHISQKSLCYLFNLCEN